MKLKVSIFALLLTTLLMCFQPLKAKSANQQQKIYLQHEQITVHNECIAIKLANDIYETTQLNKDARGYYVFASDLLKHQVEGYKCRECPFITTSGSAFYDHLKRTGHRY